jgi:ABC-type oligopeptide transport system ATPase subunit
VTRLSWRCVTHPVFSVGKGGFLGRSQSVLKAVDDASFTLAEGRLLD